MNTKNLFKVGFALIALLLMVTATSFAQQRTFYVDNAIGSDGYDGLAQSITLPSNGPKFTVNNAIAAANDGDIIFVKGTGISYVAVTVADGAVKKLLTFNSYGPSAPTLATLTVNQTAAGGFDYVTFAGPYTVSNLVLTAGTINGATNITVAASMTRTDGVVDSQLLFTGTVAIVYNSAVAASMNTGNELPLASANNVGAFTTGANPLVITRGVNMTGNFTTGAGAVDLGGNTINISKASVVGAAAADITNGTFSFTLAAAKVAGNAGFALPNITTSGAFTLAVTSASVGNLTANTDGIMTAVLSGGTGTTALLASVRGSVTNNGSGTIIIDRAVTTDILYVSGSVSNTNTGSTSIFPTVLAAGAINVAGSVSLSGTLAISAGKGLIMFGAGNAHAVTVGGSVTNNVVINGSSNTAARSGNGLILFLGTGALSTGDVTNNAVLSYTFSGTTATAANNGNITFAQLGIISMGAVANNASIAASTQAAQTTGSGLLSFTGVVAGTITAGAVSSTVSLATSDVPLSNGILSFNLASTGVTLVTSVTTSGGRGNVIEFGVGNFTSNGAITSNRTVAGADINIGTVTAATTFNAGSLVNTGKSDINVAVSQTGLVTVAGDVNMTNSGKITFANVTSSVFSFGTLTLSGTGTLNIAGAGAANGNLTTGNINLTGATIALGTGTKVWTVNGAANVIGGSSANPAFTNGLATTLTFGTPSPAQMMMITFGGLNPTYPGPVTVNNGTGLATAVEFTGGNFMLTSAIGKLNFQSGAILLSGSKIYVASSTNANDFQNASGYTTINNGYVSMANGAVTAQVSGAGAFGDFEVNSAGVAVDFISTGNFTGNFYLTLGSATTAGNIKLKNLVNYPTVVRNAGTFDALPNAQSKYSVTYIGIDKVQGFEVPTDSLWNLTVATTNGGNGGATNVFGKGAVSRGVVTITSTKVLGALTVNSGQTLALGNTAALTMMGASASIQGDVVNLVTNANNTNNLLILAAPLGTTITGVGLLPPIFVADGSVGNSITGITGVINQQLGANFTLDQAADDVVFTATPNDANGKIEFDATNSNPNALTANFGAPITATATQIGVLTMGGTKSTFTLAGNCVVTTNMVDPGGKIDVGAFTLKLLGTTHVFNKNATAVGTTGEILFKMAANGTLSITGGAATMAANVEFDTPSATPWKTTIQTSNLTFAGMLTLSHRAEVEIANGITVTATGNVTMSTSINKISTPATGILLLNAAFPPTIFTYAGTPTITNLTISNDVTLAGSGAGAVTATNFSHTAGVLNFSDRDLIFNTYTRTGGSYLATTGYFIYGGVGATFGQGNSAFSIPNLSLQNTGAASMTGTGVVTITNILKVNEALAATAFSHGGMLALADSATVKWVLGVFDAAPVYGPTMNLVAQNTGPQAIPATVWPATPTSLVGSFTVDNGGTTTDLPGARTVNTALNLTTGTLQVAANTLTMANNSTVYRTDLGFVTKAAGGSFVYGTGMTVFYQANAALTTGIELPASVANLTFSRSADVGNAITTVKTNVTVTGLLSFRNDVDNVGFPSVVVTINGNTEILNESATYPSATDPVIALTNLTIGGTGNQTLNVPSTGGVVGGLTISQTGTGSTVTVTGGPLTVNGLMKFVNGIFVTGTQPIVLNGLVDRTGVTTSNLSHIFGTVKRTIGIGAGNRYEYPVGSMTEYRPMAITFPAGLPAAIGLTVQHVDSDPLGRLGLPAPDAPAGIRIGGYPPYYWLVMALTSLGQSIPYDLELVGTSPFGRPLNRADDLRIIHRFDGNDLLNPWSLQGTGVNYSNFLAVRPNGDTVVTVRVRGQLGGMVPEASRYTIGIPTRPPIWTIGPTAATINEGQTLSIQYFADPQDVGETITYALVSGPAGAAISATGLLTWTPGYDQAGIKNIVISAFDGEFTIQMTIPVTVVNVNRAPLFSPLTVTQTITDKDTSKVTLTAVDPDAGDVLTYAFLSVAPAVTNAPTIVGNQFTWKPTFADAGKTFVFQVTASDGVTTGQGPTPGLDTLFINVTVNRSRKLGDVDGNGTVQAADASIVLQYVAGLITVTDPAELYSMDVSKNGTISAFDASLILQIAAGLIPQPTGTSPDGGLAKGVAMLQASGSLEMVSPEATTNPDVVKVGVKLSNPANVYSVALTTKADFSLVTIDAVNTSLPEGWDMKWNVVGNELRIAAAGITPLASGDFASIMVHLKNKESRLSFSTDAMLNENSQSLGAVEVAAIPTVFALEQNYPNPFNPSTTIRYQIPNAASVNLVVYNVRGQKIRTLISSEQKAGYYSVVWDGRNEAGQTVSSGLYLYRVQAGSFVATQKMIMLK